MASFDHSSDILWPKTARWWEVLLCTWKREIKVMSLHRIQQQAMDERRTPNPRPAASPLGIPPRAAKEGFKQCCLGDGAAIVGLRMRLAHSKPIDVQNRDVPTQLRLLDPREAHEVRGIGPRELDLCENDVGPGGGPGRVHGLAAERRGHPDVDGPERGRVDVGVDAALAVEQQVRLEPVVARRRPANRCRWSGFMPIQPAVSRSFGWWS